MRLVRPRLCMVLLALGVLLLSVSCGTPKVISPGPEPVAVPEPVQPTISEPKTAPAPEPPPPPPPSPKAKMPEGPYFTHTVMWPDESLATVAAWYTGNTRNWRVLADANPQLSNPNKIAVGTKIRIPEKMLRTREDMPQGFAESYAKPPKQSGAGVTGKNGEPPR
jgi:hypothetical protein